MTSKGCTSRAILRFRIIINRVGKLSSSVHEDAEYCWKGTLAALDLTGQEEPHSHLASVCCTEIQMKMRSTATEQEVGQSQTDRGSVRARHFFVDCIITAFLLLQLAIPLTYYSGVRGNDERFAWRMFSTIRQQLLSQRASSVVVESSDTNDMARRVTPVEQLVSEPWVEFIEQDQRIVVDRFLKWRYKRGDSGEVRLEVKRWNADGDSLPAVRHTIDCAASQGNSESTP